MSAVSGEGCEGLLETIARLVDDAPPVSVYATPSQGAAVAWLILHKQSERDLQMEGQYSGLLVFYGSGVASIVSALTIQPFSISAELSSDQV